MDGSVLTDGQLALDAGEALRELIILPPFAALGVNPRPSGTSVLRIDAYERVLRGADGLYAAPAPCASIEFSANVPPLHQLIGMYAAEGRKAIQLVSEGLPLATVCLPFRNPEADKSRIAFLQCDRVAIELEFTGEGLTIRFAARISSMISPPPGLDLAGTVLHGELLLCGKGLTLLGLPSRGDPNIRSESRPLSVEALRQAELGIAGTAFQLAEGHADWGQDGSNRHPRGPFLMLHLAERETGMRPYAQAVIQHDGKVAGTGAETGGPYLRLALGLADFARMLEHEDSAACTLRGAGIGHIEGRTGRDAYEEGSLRQEIGQIDLRLTRSAEGLQLEAVGELLPLPPSASDASLGPRLSFGFFLPRTLILARGWRLPRFWDDRKADTPAGDAW